MVDGVEGSFEVGVDGEDDDGFNFDSCDVSDWPVVDERAVVGVDEGEYKVAGEMDDVNVDGIDDINGTDDLFHILLLLPLFSS